MLPARIIALLLLFSIAAGAQSLRIVLKKKNQVVDRFQTGSVLAFQLDGGAWVKGEIMLIRPDSFYLRPFTIHFIMTGPDTTFFAIDGYSLADVHALPKHGYDIEYFDGAWNVSYAGGHVHWLWVKNGWIFKVLGLGYIGLQTLNGVIRNDFSLSKNAAGFAIAGAVAIGGEVLKKTYKITHRVGKKYQLSIY